MYVCVCSKWWKRFIEAERRYWNVFTIKKSKNNFINLQVIVSIDVVKMLKRGPCAHFLGRNVNWHMHRDIQAQSHRKPK